MENSLRKSNVTQPGTEGLTKFKFEEIEFDKINLHYNAIFTSAMEIPQAKMDYTYLNTLKGNGHPVRFYSTITDKSTDLAASESSNRPQAAQTDIDNTTGERAQLKVNTLYLFWYRNSSDTHEVQVNELAMTLRAGVERVLSRGSETSRIDSNVHKATASQPVDRDAVTVEPAALPGLAPSAFPVLTHQKNVDNLIGMDSEVHQNNSSSTCVQNPQFVPRTPFSVALNRRDSEYTSAHDGSHPLESSLLPSTPTTTSTSSTTDSQYSHFTAASRHVDVEDNPKPPGDHQPQQIGLNGRIPGSSALPVGDKEIITIGLPPPSTSSGLNAPDQTSTQNEPKQVLSFVRAGEPFTFDPSTLTNDEPQAAEDTGPPKRISPAGSILGVNGSGTEHLRPDASPPPGSVPQAVPLIVPNPQFVPRTPFSVALNRRDSEYTSAHDGSHPLESSLLPSTPTTTSTSSTTDSQYSHFTAASRHVDVEDNPKPPGDHQPQQIGLNGRIPGSSALPVGDKEIITIGLPPPSTSSGLNAPDQTSTQNEPKQVLSFVRAGEPFTFDPSTLTNDEPQAAEDTGPPKRISPAGSILGVNGSGTEHLRPDASPPPGSVPQAVPLIVPTSAIDTSGPSELRKRFPPDAFDINSDPLFLQLITENKDAKQNHDYIKNSGLKVRLFRCTGEPAAASEGSQLPPEVETAIGKKQRACWDDTKKTLYLIWYKRPGDSPEKQKRELAMTLREGAMLVNEKLTEKELHEEHPSKTVLGDRAKLLPPGSDRFAGMMKLGESSRIPATSTVPPTHSRETTTQSPSKAKRALEIDRSFIRSPRGIAQQATSSTSESRPASVHSDTQPDSLIATGPEALNAQTNPRTEDRFNDSSSSRVNDQVNGLMSGLIPQPVTKPNASKLEARNQGLRELTSHYVSLTMPQNTQKTWNEIPVKLEALLQLNGLTDNVVYNIGAAYANLAMNPNTQSETLKQIPAGLEQLLQRNDLSNDIVHNITGTYGYLAKNLNTQSETLDKIPTGLHTLLQRDDLTEAAAVCNIEAAYNHLAMNPNTQSETLKQIPAGLEQLLQRNDLTYEVVDNIEDTCVKLTSLGVSLEALSRIDTRLRELLKRHELEVDNTKHLIGSADADQGTKTPKLVPSPEIRKVPLDVADSRQPPVPDHSKRFQAPKQKKFFGLLPTLTCLHANPLPPPPKPPKLDKLELLLPEDDLKKGLGLDSTGTLNKNVLGVLKRSSHLPASKSLPPNSTRNSSKTNQDNMVTR